jgi:hypothetical protein
MRISARVATIAMGVLLGALTAHAADRTGKWAAEFETFDAMGSPVRIEYEGTVKDDEIAFTRKVGELATEQFVAKRARD